MGMTSNMLMVLDYLSQNRIKEAKQAAIACCAEDDTKKNAWRVNKIKNALSMQPNDIELPFQIKGLLRAEDVSAFNESRYYLGQTENDTYEKIKRGHDITERLLEMKLPYRNTTLLYGEPGTGKTEFAKYTAYKLGLPYVYINFASIIDSLLGGTSKNLDKIFDFCKGYECVLMLDEIDCIGLRRGKDGGPDGELGRTTITLLQGFDSLVNGQIVIAATNREDRLDKALVRRFQNIIEFGRYEKEERYLMIKKITDDFRQYGMEFTGIEDFAKKELTQADIMKQITEAVCGSVYENKRTIELC